VLPKLAPYIQEVFLLAKIAAWQQKHMTLAVDYRLMDEWNELQALKQQTPLPCPVLLLEAQAA
jgi:hypothetical protein